MSDLFDFKPKPLNFAVLGNPITHSKSPRIHELFAQQFNIKLDYSKTLVEHGGFIVTVEHFFANGGKGLNVTVPYKLDAQKMADECTERAIQAGAVNTLWQEDGKIIGDNTDGEGLCTDIERNLGVSFAEKSVLILGAGGAVRGILPVILGKAPKRIFVANRTLTTAVELKKAMAALGTLEVSGYDDVPNEAFDLIINGTAASLEGKLPPLPKATVAKHTLAYDLMYAPQPTVFMKWALECGAEKVSDGLGMLVEQAAAAFSIWHGKKPETAVVIKALRADH